MSESTGNPVRIGIIGAGNISEVYCRNLTSMFDNTTVVGIADIVLERAQERADQFGIEALSVDELIDHPDIELVVNLTIPAAHAAIAMRALAAGKSVYNEKPIATSLEDGEAMLTIAKEKGLVVGSAPDTFLGGGLQTVRQLLDDGLIGEPVAFNAAMLGHGMEMWHPDPFFFFQPGAGPLFDVGVYYVTALVSLLGPVGNVAAHARASFPERTIGNGPKLGQTIPVTTPTHIVSTVEFETGVIGTLSASFDTWETDHAALTIYGTEGTLRLPDPNTFGGPIQHLKGGEDEWRDIEITAPYTENSRGLGASDLARAIRTGETSRVDGALGYHVLEIMHAVLDAADEGRRVDIESTVARPAPLEAVKV